MTPRNLCTLALKLCGALGVGQTPLQSDIDDSLSLLNMMIAQWAQRRWLVYHLVDVSFAGTGAPSYTIGPSGDVNTVRPDRLEAAFARSISSGQDIDYPLQIIEAREDWNRLPLKGYSGFPTTVFYDSAYPVGTLYVNPLPSAQYEIHLSLKQPLSSFADTSADIALPDEYQEALLYNLAARLAPMYGLALRPDVVALASAALNTIRNSNTQIGTLRMPSGLPGTRRGGFSTPISVAYPPPVDDFLSGIGVLDSDTGAGGADGSGGTGESGGGGVIGGDTGGGSGGSGGTGSSGGTSTPAASILGQFILGTTILGA